MQKIIELNGLTWRVRVEHLPHKMNQYTAQYNKSKLEVSIRGSKKWLGMVTYHYYYRSKDNYTTRKAAMEGSAVLARFVGGESVLSISENLHLKVSDVEKHIRKWV